MSDNASSAKCVADGTGRATGAERAHPLLKNPRRMLATGAAGAPFPNKFSLAENAKIVGYVLPTCISKFVWEEDVREGCARCARSDVFQSFFMLGCARSAPVAACRSVTMRRSTERPNRSASRENDPLSRCFECRRTARRNCVAVCRLSADMGATQ